MYKRKIYLALSTLPILIPLLIGYISGQFWGPFIGSFLLLNGAFLVYRGILLSIREKSFVSVVPFAHGLFTIFYKKINYSKLGTFYIKYNENDIRVYKQGIFCLDEVLLLNNYYDINETKNTIKNSLDSMYENEIRKKERRDKKLSNIKNWDGYVDKQSKRSGRLEEIIK